MHGLLRSILAIGLLSLLGACAEPVSRHEAPRILAMGDSLLSWNRATGRSVAHGVEGLLNEPVVDRSVPGAHVIYALPISGSLGLKIDRQYRAGDWDWIILNGGGNDLWLGCGCGACDGRMGRMLTPDGASGAIAASVFRLRATGARVIYLGYLRSPGRGSPIEHCRDDGDELERRLARLAGRDPGITFVPIGDMVPYGDRSYHSFDMIHPSAKASAEIAARVVSVIRSGE